MIRREFLKKLTSFYPNLGSVRRSSQLDIEQLEKQSAADATVEVINDDEKLREEEIQIKRNKSRLRPAHREIVHDRNPYPEPLSWHHGTLKYLRRTYGVYGQASGVSPSLCWPVKEELEESLEYERVKYPYTIPEVVAEAKEQRRQKEERKIRRQQDIVQKMEKLEVWKQDLYSRIAKKEAEARAVKERKERLIEDVKRHFGYTVDPRDDRFKEMLEKKEKEQKKAMKEARRKARDEKMVEKILKKKVENKAPEPEVENKAE